MERVTQASRQNGRDIAAQRRAKVAKLLAQGKTQREMAAEVGCGLTTINRDLKALRKEWVRAHLEHTQEAMADDLYRIRVALAAVWPEVEKGDLAAVDRAVSLLSLRAKLLGFESIRVELTTGGGAIKLVAVNLSAVAEELAAAPEEVEA